MTNVLNQYHKKHMLTWHDGAIPENEVWIKVGGDHGGGTFKMMVQVVNVTNPNSKHNTFVTAIANCKDNPENMNSILGQ